MKYYFHNKNIALEIPALDGLQQAMHHSRYYREPDFLKPKSGKTLFKQFDRLTKNEDKAVFGGIHGSIGAHQKQKTSGEPRSVYLANRLYVSEYFMMEILNYLGFKTPKTRVAKKDNGYFIVTAAIENFVPFEYYLGPALPIRMHNRLYRDLLASITSTETLIASYSERLTDPYESPSRKRLLKEAIESYEKFGKHGSDDHLLKEYRQKTKKDENRKELSAEYLPQGKMHDSSKETFERYEINFDKQAVWDAQEQRFIPIRGHCNAAYFVIHLIQDHDLSGCANMALVREGNSFNLTLIDKDVAPIAIHNTFNNDLSQGEEYSDLFNSTTFEQKISMIANIAALLTIENGQSPLEKIFFNPRTSDLLKTSLVDTLDTFFSSLLKETSGISPEKMGACRSLMNTYIESFKAAHSNDQLTNYANADKYVDDVIALGKKIHQSFIDEKIQLSDQHGQILNTFLNKNTAPWNPCLIADVVARNGAIIINHYLKSPEKLQNYYKREDLRHQLAKKIIHNELPDDSGLHKSAIANLVEDLRGIRFKHLLTGPNHLISEADLNNSALITALTESIRTEYPTVVKAQTAKP